MTIMQAAKQVADNRQAVLIRTKKDGRGYDMKPLDCGNKRGWVLLDGMTAQAILLVVGALSDANQSKVDSVPLDKLVRFCWKQVGV